MTAKIALLPDRGVVSVTGEDAAKFLDNIITNDMALLGTQSAIFAGLLSPQGKILFDFFVVKHSDGYLLDVAKDKAAELAKRLSMYKLRAKVAIADVSEQRAVIVRQDCHIGEHAICIVDPRDKSLWNRCLLLDSKAFGGALMLVTNKGWGTPDDYHAHRIALGVPEGGRDYAFGDAFPHEALFDQLHGVSFTKGCYVGQEIVARMEHRGTARKRVVRVTADAPLPPTGTEIKAGEVAIGTMGSAAGNLGLAMLRLDRAAEFEAKGVPLTAGGVTISPDSFDMARLMPKSLDPTGL